MVDFAFVLCGSRLRRFWLVATRSPLAGDIIHRPQAGSYNKRATITLIFRCVRCGENIFYGLTASGFTISNWPVLPIAYCARSYMLSAYGAGT